MNNSPAILEFDPRQRDRAALDAATAALVAVLARELNMTPEAVTEALETALAMVNVEIIQTQQCDATSAKRTSTADIAPHNID